MPVVGIYRPPAARLLLREDAACNISEPHTTKAVSRQKRPDLQVYVPRAARRLVNDPDPPSPSEVTHSPAPKPARHRSPNVVTPRKKNNKSCEKPETLTLANRTPSCDSDLSIDNEQSADKFITPTFQPNEQRLNDKTNVDKTPVEEVKAPIVPPLLKISDCVKTTPPQKLNKSELEMDKSEAQEIKNGTDIKHSTNDKEELKKVSPPVKVRKEEEKKLQPTVNLNIDECSWDMLFDENGDCLEPSIMDELSQAVGKVRVTRPAGDYSAYETAREAMLAERDYPHVLEIYGFSAEFKTQDLMAVLVPLAGTAGCDLKWVDDTHALAVFSNSQIAAEVLALNHPLLQTRPLSQASAESRQKARRSSQFLQPYKPRPETCTALAKRMVSSALGVRLHTTKEERERERTLLREAREKKRLAAKLSEEAWEGKISSSNKES